jgi:membrane-associated phospholipid phosphatase
VPPPPAFGSAAFNTDLNEVLTISQTRTVPQVASAHFWNSPAGTPTPLGIWNELAATWVQQAGLDERAATRVLALMQAAQFDAQLGCFEAKYVYFTIRPAQANPAISLVFPSPNRPSYPSGHSCISASSARVLEHFFPERAAALSALVSDAGLSRLYAGIHYRFDIAAGQTLGRAVADWAIARDQATP